MVIGIDASRANKKKKTGVEWYSYYLIQELKNVVPANVTVRLYSSRPLEGDLAQLPANWESHVLGWPPKFLWTLGRLSWEMLVRPPDLLFIPAHVLPLVVPRRSVLTIHDIGFDRYPELYPVQQRWYHRWNTARTCRVCTKVITVSEFTKRELVDVYGRSCTSKTMAIPLAHDTTRYHDHIAQAERERVRTAYNIGGPYFVYLGRIERKKNTERILRAFTEFAATDTSGHQLVLVGPRGHVPDEVDRLLKQPLLQQRVRQLSWVPSADVPPLLAEATALVFPTMYEGFGLPALEAMAVGTPVITSKGSATEDVVADAALVVEPTDQSAIREALRKVATDQVLREELRTRGLTRAQAFSWRRAAEATWQVFAEALDA